MVTVEKGKLPSPGPEAGPGLGAGLLPDVVHNTALQLGAADRGEHSRDNININLNPSS